jgi:hypothetical protein
MVILGATVGLLVRRGLGDQEIITTVESAILSARVSASRVTQNGA